MLNYIIRNHRWDAQIYLIFANHLEKKTNMFRENKFISMEPYIKFQSQSVDTNQNLLLFAILSKNYDFARNIVASGIRLINEIIIASVQKTILTSLDFMEMKNC